MLEPSRWVMRFLPGVVAGGRVLDVACGSGRHLRAALATGYRVTGVDRDLSGVRDLAGAPGVELVKADLEAGTPVPFADRQFDGVIVTNYLWRTILPDIVAAVSPTGILIYETFGLGNERYGRPSNPDFLLKPGELVASVSPLLTPIAFDTVTNVSSGPAVIQRITAVGSRHPWLLEPPTKT